MRLRWFLTFALVAQPCWGQDLAPGQFAELGGVRLWYRDSGGTGVPVIFLHAASGNSEMWEHQLPPFIAAGYRFIAYDRRGHGRSVAMESAGRGSLAGDLELLVKHLNLDRFHLVGTAAGGGAAFDYALSFPQRLRSLVIANSLGGVTDPDYVAMGRRIRPPPHFEALPVEFRELGPSYRAANPDGVVRWMGLAKSGKQTSGPSNRITFSALETIGVPVLLLTGDADLYTPPPVLKMFAERIKGASTLIVPECGHSAYWEQPEIFNRAVLDFVRRTSAAAGRAESPGE